MHAVLSTVNHYPFAAAKAILRQSFLHTGGQQHCPILAGSLPIGHWEQVDGQVTRVLLPCLKGYSQQG